MMAKPRSCLAARITSSNGEDPDDLTRSIDNIKSICKELVNRGMTVVVPTLVLPVDHSVEVW